MEISRKEKERLTRERILDAAAKIVSKHGVLAATTKRIATEAGVAEGSLYHHFSDKAQLLIAIVMERLPSIMQFFQKLDRSRGDSLQMRLAVALPTMIAFYTQAHYVIGGISSDPQLLELCRRRFFETNRGPHLAHEKLAEFLLEEQKLGNINPAIKPAVLASLLIGACTEYAALKNLTGKMAGELNDIEYAKAVVETLLPVRT